MTAEDVQQQVQAAIDAAWLEQSEEAQADIESAVSEAMAEQTDEVRRLVEEAQPPTTVGPFTGCAEYRDAVRAATPGDYLDRVSAANDYAHSIFDTDALTVRQNWLLDAYASYSVSGEVSWEEFSALSELAAPEAARSAHRDLLVASITHAELGSTLATRILGALPYGGMAPTDISDADFWQARAALDDSWDALETARRLAIANCPDADG